MSIFGVIKEVKFIDLHEDGKRTELELKVYDNRFPKGDEYPFANQTVILIALREDESLIRPEMSISCNSELCWIGDKIAGERWLPIKLGGLKHEIHYIL